MAYKYLVSVKWVGGTDKIIPVQGKSHEDIVQHFYNTCRPLSEAQYFHIYKLEKFNLPIKENKNDRKK